MNTQQQKDKIERKLLRYAVTRRPSNYPSVAEIQKVAREDAIGSLRRRILEK
jgi:hypothetical protein